MKYLMRFLILLIGFSLNAQLPNTLSNSEKIYGLSKFWQEVNYNFIYLNKIDREQWDNDYKALITEVQETENDYDYFRLLQKFCASLKDGHTNVFLPQSINDSIYNTYFGEYRLFLKNVDHKAIVARINLSKKDEIPVGSEIIKVNGLDTQTYIEQEVEPYISSSTDYILEDWAISRLLQAPKGTSFEVTFRLPNGEIKELSLTHDTTLEEDVYPPFDDWKLFEFKMMDNDIGYISLNSFGDDEISQLFRDNLTEIKKAKKLIIDLRSNTGGNTNIGYDILQYLTNDDALYGSASKTRLHIPSFKAWGKWVKAEDTISMNKEDKAWTKKALSSYKDHYYHDFPYSPRKISLTKKERIVVPTVLLIGHDTASAAEDFLIAADSQQHMTKIGEPTNGSTGQPLFFDLPGGASARICTKKDSYPDGREFVGVGIQPDILVTKSLEDHMNDRDPALEQALEFLKNTN